MYYQTYLMDYAKYKIRLKRCETKSMRLQLNRNLTLHCK